MGSQKMVEHVEECENMGLVLTLLAGAYVVDDHVANDFTAAIAVHEIDGKAGSSESGTCSCSAMARTSASVRPEKATQSSRLIIKHPLPSASPSAGKGPRLFDSRSVHRL